MQSQNKFIFDKLKRCTNKQKIDDQDVGQILDLINNADEGIKSNTLLLLKVWLDFDIIRNTRYVQKINNLTKEKNFELHCNSVERMRKILTDSFNGQKLHYRQKLYDFTKNKNTEITGRLFSIIETDNTELKKIVAEITLLNKAQNENLNDQAIQEIINYGADLETTMEDENTALHIAAQASKAQNVQALLKNNANANSTNKNLDTPLHIAVEHRYAAIVKNLIDAGANVNCMNNNLNTPLHIALKCQDAEIEKDLINAGADIAMQNKEGKTALDIAVKNQSIEIIDIFVANGADINTQKRNGDTYLNIAVKEISAKMVEKLISLKCNLNLENNKGETPLHKAAINKDGDTIEKLLKAGADPNYTSNKIKTTPLHIAAQNNNEKVAQKLINYRAKIEAKAKEFKIVDNYSINSISEGQARTLKDITPIHAASYGSAQDCAQLLIDSGANLNTYTQEGFTVLDFATFNNDTFMIDFLLKSQKIDNKTKQKGLSYAIEKGFLAGINTILKAGISLVYEKGQTTALHALAKHNPNIDIAKQLIERGIDINARDKIGNTALHISLQDKKYVLAELLLKNKAQKNIKNNKDETPKDILDLDKGKQAKPIKEALMQEERKEISELIIRTIDQGITGLELKDKEKAINDLYNKFQNLYKSYFQVMFFDFSLDSCAQSITNQILECYDQETKEWNQSGVNTITDKLIKPEEGNGLFFSQEDKNDQTKNKIVNDAQDLYLTIVQNQEFINAWQEKNPQKVNTKLKRAKIQRSGKNTCQIM